MLWAQSPKQLVIDRLDVVYPAGHSDAGAEYYVYSAVYPIGWSKDSKFAWINDDVADVEAGENFFSLRVLDATTDSLVVNWQRAAENSDDFWTRYADDIRGVLKEHSIQQQTDFVLEQFPIKMTDVKSYSNEWMYLNTMVDRSVDYAEANTVNNKNRRHLVYQLESSMRGSKAVFYTKSLAGDTWDYVLHGYLKSPFENRVLLVHTYGAYITCGGYYTGVKTGFVGAHLSYGFK